QPSDGYHVVPPPYTGTFMPPKPDLVLNTAPTAVETGHSTFNVQLSTTKPEQDLSHTNRPTAPIIKDWVSNSEDDSETKAPQIVPSFLLKKTKKKDKIGSKPDKNGDDANKHLDKFLHVTQSIKVNRVTDDALRLYLFPHSLTPHATAWFDRFPRNSLNTFEQMAKMFLGKYFPLSMVTKLTNKITNFRQHPDESLFEAWECYKLSIDRCPNHNMLPVTQIDTFYNGLTLRHHDTINAATGGTFIKRRLEECYDLIKNMTAHNNDWDTLCKT
nr:reverse transcriptase domain-containing protein [Tanacetum cinerariifolium]